MTYGMIDLDWISICFRNLCISIRFGSKVKKRNVDFFQEILFASTLECELYATLIVVKPCNIIGHMGVTHFRMLDNSNISRQLVFSSKASFFQLHFLHNLQAYYKCGNVNACQITKPLCLRFIFTHSKSRLNLRSFLIMCTKQVPLDILDDIIINYFLFNN